MDRDKNGATRPTVKDEGDLTEDFIAFLRAGVHTIYCAPHEDNGKGNGRFRVRSDLVAPLGDESGDYPCLCHERTITYNGIVIPPDKGDDSRRPPAIRQGRPRGTGNRA